MFRDGFLFVIFGYNLLMTKVILIAFHTFLLGRLFLSELYLSLGRAPRLLNLINILRPIDNFLVFTLNFPIQLDTLRQLTFSFRQYLKTSGYCIRRQQILVFFRILILERLHLLRKFIDRIRELTILIFLSSEFLWKGGWALLILTKWLFFRWGFVWWVDYRWVLRFEVSFEHIR